MPLCLKQNVLWWRNNISFKENTENVVYMITGKTRSMKIIVKFRAEKILCPFLSCNKCSFEENKISCRKTIAMFIWKWNRSFEGHTLVYDLWKKYLEVHICSLWCSQEPKILLKHKKDCVPKIPILSTLKLYSCKLVVFIDINTYILPGDRNFKTFMKENHGITLDNCYVFTKEHRIEVDTDSA